MTVTAATAAAMNTISTTKTMTIAVMVPVMEEPAVRVLLLELLLAV